MSKLVVGLTGGIGSGKSAVSELFEQQGITVVDADVIAREVVEPGTSALSDIVARFGPDILSDGELDRTKLRKIVFDSPEHKSWLSELLHPKIREQMILQTQQAPSDYCILAVPLLVENGMNKMVNRVLVVDVEESIQLARATQRDHQSAEQIRKIMQAQASREQRLAVADDVIDNNGAKEALHKQVFALHQSYLNIAKSLAKA